MARRPVLITIFAALSFVATAQYVVLAVLWLVYRPALVAFLHALSPGGSGPEKVHLAMGRFEPVYYVVMAVVTALLGRGLWKLQNWTRIFMLVMVGISLIALVATSKLALGSGSASAIALWLLRAGLCLTFITYLASGKVRGAFRNSKRAAAAQQ